ALFAFWRVREQRVWFLGGLTILSLILALGDQGHLYGWLRQVIPHFGFMRYPIKFVTLATFSVPLLAAFAVRYFQESPRDITAWRHPAFLVLALLTLIAGILWFGYQYPLVEEQWAVTLRSGLSRAAFLLLIMGILSSLRLLERR